MSCARARAVWADGTILAKLPDMESGAGGGAGADRTVWHDAGIATELRQAIQNTRCRLFLVWLAFYPNAPYVFTDFIHVVRRANLGAVALPWLSQADLLWYDIVMHAAFAFVCHYIGLVSMYIMHGAMRTMFGKVAGWSMMVPAILLSGFGIHIGRFSRFDSWDLVMQPVQTVRVISQSLADPAALLFSAAFAFFIALTYIIFYIVKRADLG